MTSGFKHFLIIVLLISSVLFAYWNIDKCGYIHFDDLDYVTLNYHIFSGFTATSIKWAFCSFYAANWHPLTWLSHMLDYQLYGLKPAGPHLTNLLFHALNTVLLFLALRSMTGTVWRSALVAALFGLHPLHVESVAWVSERKDVLCACFMFITLLCYSSYVHRNRHRGFYFATLFFFILGLLSKPMIVTLPFVFLLCDFWPFRRLTIEINPNLKLMDRYGFYKIIPLFIEKIPFFILSIGSCIVTAMAQKAYAAMYLTGELPFLFRLNNSLISYMEYCIKMVWPIHLSFFYPLVLEMPLYHLKILFASILLLSISVVAALRIKKQPYLLVGWLWFLGMLVPVIGIIQVGSQAMADRYTYLPLIGLFIFVVWLLYDLARRARWLKITAISASVVVLAFLIFLTRIQASYWKNDLTISEHALSVTQYNFLAYTMKGIFLYTTGDYDNALRCYDKSLSINPNQMVPRLNIGCIFLTKGKTKEAIEIFKALSASDSNNALAYLNCGKAFVILDQKDSAIGCFSHALAIEPNLSSALFNLGKLYLGMGEYQKSMPYLQQARRTDPNDPEIYFELGNCSMKSNSREEAIKWYEKSISLDPSFVVAHRQLALALEACGNHGLAQKQASIADSIVAILHKKAPQR